MVNGISEKALSVNHKVKIVNFLDGTSEKILEKLDEIIKEKPHDLTDKINDKIKDNIDILMIWENKVDDSFPDG